MSQGLYPQFAIRFFSLEFGSVNICKFVENGCRITAHKILCGGIETHNFKLNLACSFVKSRDSEI